MTVIVAQGNFREAVVVFTAPPGDPTAASTAVSFTLTEPDGTELTVSSPNAAIDGPTAGDAGGLVTTEWTWTTPVLNKPGRYYVVARSTAGLIAVVEVPLIVERIHA